MTLRISDLSFSYGSLKVLDHLTLTVSPGRSVGLLGPNGSGKSTLVSCLAQIRRYRGDIEFEGMRGEDLREVTGYMPQDLPGHAALTVLESVLVASRRSIAWRTSAQDVERAWSVLADFGVEHLADRMLGHLSGGQRQLVALSQALVRDPRLILLDEPTSALDLRHQVSVLSRVQELCRGTDRLALIAVHDLNLAARFCDELVVLSGGSIIAQGPPREVLTPSILQDVYGIGARIIEDGDHVLVVPHTI